MAIRRIIMLSLTINDDGSESFDVENKGRLNLNDMSGMARQFQIWADVLVMHAIDETIKKKMEESPNANQS